MKSAKIFINPCFNMFYYSFYLKGIVDIYGKDSIRYSIDCFPLFTPKCFAFIVSDNGVDKNIIIDATDGTDIREVELGWCDIYGKVNCSSNQYLGKGYNKIIPIGPNFSINVFDMPTSIFKAITCLLLSHGRIKDTKDHFANYRRQYKYRVKEEVYFPSKSCEKYIFFTSTLWKGDEETNIFRKQFIDACMQIEALEFEGGFSPFLPGHKVLGYEKYQLSKRYSISEYINKIKKSSVVFNTPAVYKCHGWKFGEYLALGKAIISTPLSREMPAELVHGEHIHYTDGSTTDNVKSIKYILNNKSYKNELEVNARNYYEKYLSPKSVVLRLV